MRVSILLLRGCGVLLLLMITLAYLYNGLDEDGGVSGNESEEVNRHSVKKDRNRRAEVNSREAAEEERRKAIAEDAEKRRQEGEARELARKAAEEARRKVKADEAEKRRQEGEARDMERTGTKAPGVATAVPIKPDGTKDDSDSVRLAAEAAELARRVDVDEYTEEQKLLLYQNMDTEEYHFWDSNHSDCSTGSRNMAVENGNGSRTVVRIMHEKAKLIDLVTRVRIKNRRWTGDVVLRINGTPKFLSVAEYVLTKHLGIDAENAIAIMCNTDEQSKLDAQEKSEAFWSFIKRDDLFYTYREYDDGGFGLITRIDAPEQLIGFNYLLEALYNFNSTYCTSATDKSVSNETDVRMAPVIVSHNKANLSIEEPITIVNGRWTALFKLETDNNETVFSVSDALLRYHIQLSAEEALEVLCDDDIQAKESAESNVVKFMEFLQRTDLIFTCHTYRDGSLGRIARIRTAMEKKADEERYDFFNMDMPSCNVRKKRAAEQSATEGVGSQKEVTAVAVTVGLSVRDGVSWNMQISVVENGQSTPDQLPYEWRISDSVIRDFLGMSVADAEYVKCFGTEEEKYASQAKVKEFEEFLLRPDLVWFVEEFTDGRLPRVVRLHTKKEWSEQVKEEQCRTEKEEAGEDDMACTSSDLNTAVCEMQKHASDDDGDVSEIFFVEEEDGPEDEDEDEDNDEEKPEEDIAVSLGDDDKDDEAVNDQPTKDVERLRIMAKLESYSEYLALRVNSGRLVERDFDRYKRLHDVVVEIYDIVEKSQLCSLRAFFYRLRDLGIIQKGRQMQTDISRISRDLGVTRRELNLIPHARGRIIGDINFLLTDTQYSSRRLITPVYQEFLEAVITTSAKIVIAVESEAYMQLLIDSGIIEKYPEILLLSGRGFPDYTTRRLLKRLVKETKLEAFGVFDMDPFGFSISLNYKYGTKHGLVIENTEGIVQELQHIAVTPDIAEQLSLTTRPMTESELETAKQVLAFAKEKGDTEAATQIEKMIQTARQCSLVQLPLDALIAILKTKTSLLNRPASEITKPDDYRENNNARTLPKLIVTATRVAHYWTPGEVFFSKKYNENYESLTAKYPYILNRNRGDLRLKQIFDELPVDEQARYEDMASEINRNSGAKINNNRAWRGFYCLRQKENFQRLSKLNPRLDNKQIHELCKKEIKELDMHEKEKWKAMSHEYYLTHRQHEHLLRIQDRYESAYCLEESKAFKRLKGEKTDLEVSEIQKLCLQEYAALPTKEKILLRPQIDKFLKENLSSAGQGAKYYCKPINKHLGIISANNPGMSYEDYKQICLEEYQELPTLSKYRWCLDAKVYYEKQKDTKNQYGLTIEQRDFARRFHRSTAGGARARIRKARPGINKADLDQALSKEWFTFTQKERKEWFIRATEKNCKK